MKNKSLYFFLDRTINPANPKINTPNKDNMRGQLTITSIGEGEYYGFELEDSKLFFLEDFTVTHNTSFVDNCFVLNPFDFVKSKENVNNIKLKIIYRFFIFIIGFLVRKI